MAPSSLNPWTKVKEKVIFRNPYIGLRNDDVLTPDGKLQKYIVVENRDFVDVFCVTPENTFIMVHQYRYPWQQFSWEPPAGVIEPGELPETAARREVEEETGYQVTSLTLLAKVHPFAMTQGWAYVFLAEVRSGGQQHLDESEFLEYAPKTIDEIEKLIHDGQFAHGISLLGWNILQSRKLGPFTK